MLAGGGRGARPWGAAVAVAGGGRRLNRLKDAVGLVVIVGQPLDEPLEPRVARDAVDRRRVHRRLGALQPLPQREAEGAALIRRALSNI